MAEFTLPANSKIDKSAGRSHAAPAGAKNVRRFVIYRFDPHSGQIVAHLAPTVELAYAVPSADGRLFYGLDAGAPNGECPVRLLVLDGVETREVAERLNVTPNAVRIAKSRVLSRFRSEIEGLID